MLPHDQSLSEVDFVAFDLETTGLFPVVNRIVEFGAVRFRLDGRELDTFEHLVDPECPIPPRVTDIHGITGDMVRGKPTLPHTRHLTAYQTQFPRTTTMKPVTLEIVTDYI